MPVSTPEFFDTAASSIVITQRDGTDLPNWLYQQGGRIFVQHRPADVETVHLRVKIATTEDEFDSIYVELNIITGEMRVEALDSVPARGRQPNADAMPAANP